MCFLPHQPKSDTCAGDQRGDADSLPDQQPPRPPPRFCEQFDPVRQAEQDQPGGGDVAERAPRRGPAIAAPDNRYSEDRPPDQFKRIDEVDVCQRLHPLSRPSAIRRPPSAVPVLRRRPDGPRRHFRSVVLSGIESRGPGSSRYAAGHACPAARP